MFDKKKYTSESNSDIKHIPIRFVIIGYYEHNNIGDDQYIETFQYILNNLKLNKTNTFEFVDCDTLPNFDIVESDIIIIGGGDILNHYFLDIINVKFKGRNNKIIAVSVGMPYIDILVNTNKLEILDAIFVRTLQDFDTFRCLYSDERIFYLPDISLFMNKINYNVVSKPYNVVSKPVTYMNINSKLNRWKKDGYKTVVFSLNRHIYSKETIEIYTSIVDEFVFIIKWLLFKGYKICFLPFNTATNDNNKNNIPVNTENDVLFHNDICSILFKDLPSNYIQNILNIQIRLTPCETYELFDYFHISIPMRFHATLFSVYKNIPFLPIFTTKKIRNLLLDIEYKYKYELEVDHKDMPINMSSSILKEKISEVLCKFNEIKYLLNNICNKLELDMLNNIPMLLYIIKNKQSKLKTLKMIEKKHNLISELLMKLNEFCNGDDFLTISDPYKQHIIVSIVSFYLTGGKIKSQYNYGLMEKMFDNSKPYNYLDEWNWIINDNLIATNGGQYTIKDDSNITNNNPRIFNIHYMNQEDDSSVHRSGWNYVYHELKKYHSSDENAILLDLYIDRTFHWERDILKAIGIIPYRKKWCGFLHHTFDTTFSEFNNVNLLKNPDFIESLKCCEYIFVLSKTLELKLREELFNININNVRVVSLVHPSEIEGIPSFNYSEFLSNPDKKILHIGGWLRNIFSFYYIQLPNNIPLMDNNYKSIIKSFLRIHKCKQYPIKKFFLKNSNGNNYYPYDNFKEIINNSLKSENKHTTLSTDNHISQNNSSSNEYTTVLNNWYRHFLHYIDGLLSDINIIDKLKNDEYDKLLTNNILFINLIDASAVNTIIECIIRNTPILVNRHPAIVELLGDKYPLYYENTNNYYKINLDIVRILNDPYSIYKAYKYLSKIDKKIFQIKSFKNDLMSYLSISNTNDKRIII